MWLGTVSRIWPMPCVAQGGDPGVVLVLRADLGVELLVVGDVVAVLAAGPRLQDRARRSSG